MSTLTLLACLAVSYVAGAGTSNALQFEDSNYATRHGSLAGNEVTYRAYEGIAYVRRPVDSHYQTLNVYMPEAYANGGTINGYQRATAPIFLPNTIGGYMPGAAGTPGGGMDRMHNAILRALAHGYVVISPGARGRTLKDAQGLYTGKAPAALVDLKAAIRYIKFNRNRLPGNVDRIVSNGTSAVGAMSTLLGATGNSQDYRPYLQALGAADAHDDVWAVSAYCPITNLDHADSAYEWLLNGVNTSKGFHPGGMPPMGQMPPGGGPPPGGAPFGQPPSSDGTMDATQIAHSAELKAMFPAYVNSLHLRDSEGHPLSLDKDGKGSFKNYVKGLLVDSARRAQAKGVNLSNTSWVQLRDGKVVDIDWDGFVKSVGRMKQTSAFDSPALTTGENNEFGSETVDNQHFTEFGMTHNTVKGATLADPAVIKMMNPMKYIGKPGSDVAPFWRIRHGAIDRDTSVAVPAILATKLSNAGLSVDFEIPWNTPHSGDYDLDELFAWIDSHAK